jgi:predicted ATPase/class 3 adenylate cyclase
MTDIEGSTALWDRLGTAMSSAIESHHALLRRLFRQHGGSEFREQGDGFIVAFQGVGDALACAVALQRALADGLWVPEEASLPAPVRVRAALHTGDARIEEGEYRTPVLHLAQRVLTAAHGGQTLCSEATATLLRRETLPGARLVDLGVYLLRGFSEPERLFEIEHAGRVRDTFPPLRADARHAGHLPPSFSRFFGREEEIDRLCKLLGSVAESPVPRLMTLMGPGGTGKTRLALEVARRLVQEWRGAIWFVPLADVTEADRIPDAIRQAMEIPPAPEQTPLEQVAATLGDRSVLLLLDNLEHLLPEGALQIRTLVERLPAVTCLVTSRRRVRLSGERVFAVPPLPSFPSIQLFVDRAQAGNPEFALLEGNAEAVALICRRLEGLPLAIELAAARAGVLTPTQILAQLGRGLEVLASQLADVAERHRSLRATVAWSYRLLDPELQRFFRGLSVFQGGCSLEAAEVVCGGVTRDEWNVLSEDGPPVLDWLEELRECSLLVTEDTALGLPSSLPEIRFRMLETLREFGREQSTQRERTELQQRHAQYCLGLAERAEREFAGPEQQQWYERLEIDHDNLRAAFDRYVEWDDAAAGTRLGKALMRFWSVRGYLTEGRNSFARLLALPGMAALPDARATALNGAGGMALRQGDYQAARWYFEEGLALWREIGDRSGIAAVLNNLGNLLRRQGDHATARSLYEESLALCRELGDRHRVAYLANHLGLVAMEEEKYEEAQALLGESLALHREMNDPRGIAHSLHNLGIVRFHQGDPATARALFEEGLALRRDLGDRQSIGIMLGGLGEIAYRQGDDDAARGFLEESVAICRELGDREALSDSLATLGAVVLRQGDPTAARELLEESLTLFREQRDTSGIDRTLAKLAEIARDQGGHSTAS